MTQRFWIQGETEISRFGHGSCITARYGSWTSAQDGRAHPARYSAGEQRADIFRCVDDYEFFLAALGYICREEQVEVHSYTLMTNHVHLIMTPRTVGAVSVAMQGIGRLYVLYFNRRYERTGGLGDGRFKSFIIDTESYWFTCMRYVELNPVRAGMVSHPHQYRWSSYAGNALGVTDPILTAHSLYVALGASDGARQTRWRELCDEPLDDAQLVEIRRAVQKGGVLGPLLLSESADDES